MKESTKWLNYVFVAGYLKYIVLIKWHKSHSVKIHSSLYSWNLQIITFCFYFHFKQPPSFFFFSFKQYLSFSTMVPQELCMRGLWIQYWLLVYVAGMRSAVPLLGCSPLFSGVHVTVGFVGCQCDWSLHHQWKHTPSWCPTWDQEVR